MLTVTERDHRNPTSTRLSDDDLDEIKKWLKVNVQSNWYRRTIEKLVIEVELLRLRKKRGG